ncbi:MAG: glucoamylase family protein [Bryobacteraceae bacterium]
MELHGKTLAVSHKISEKQTPDRLLRRLADNEEVLSDSSSLLAAAVRADRRVSPAAEWLLDNLYLIEEQIRMARRHLPKGYSRELPSLLNGPSIGFPRVYDIALETIAHGDGRVDPEILSRFISAYQTVRSLKLGELWAVPIMLRLALIENLRRIATRLSANRIDRNVAHYWADKMTVVAEKDPKSLILVSADMARSGPPMSGAFVAELARRLQGQSPVLAMPLTWVEQRLAESGQTIEQVIQLENQKQAGDQVSISNTIGSLRFLTATDWREFVESMSLVEKTLREDPAGVYASMDFATRDRYRHIVESLAKTSPLTEGAISRRAIELTQEAAADKGPSSREAHVGYFLVDKGRPALEQTAKVRLPVVRAFRRRVDRFPLLLYVGGILLVSGLFSFQLLWRTNLSGPLLALAITAAVIAASHLAVSLVNWLVTLLRKPDALPSLDFSKGIPSECRTVVAIPTMLTSKEGIDSLAESLEVRFLANRDPSLHFVLLTDFADADSETVPGDEALLLLAKASIDLLNEKYRNGSNDKFFLLHRPRRWNPAEKIWMGYERKRGKLGDLNALLRGDADERFSLLVGDTDLLVGAKYVITLDTDTQLPRDSAQRLVAAIAHPLNQPRYDEKAGRVTEGYGILQPRVSVSLPNTNRSRYARMFGSSPGVDPYTRVVSDVYQDLFHEGSFIGKGIYDVDAFERSLCGRFPENRILSHDLIEGCYTRAGLLSGVQLYEEYPLRYSADVSRRHRWIRGDWQIARWLWPRIPTLGGERVRNPLSGLSKWKIFDNLRRSLVAPALITLLLMGWLLVSPPWLWTWAVLGIILIPSLIASSLEILRKPADLPMGQHLAGSVISAYEQFLQSAFTFACLPYEALFNGDAVVRTWYRMLLSKRRLLEWNPASGHDRKHRSQSSREWMSMWFAPFFAAAVWIGLYYGKPHALSVAWPVLGLWASSPAIAWWVSRRIRRPEARLTFGQTIFLRKLARKTWAFFEQFVSVEDNWLPPDNYQEHPVEVAAHRTSPTNIGLYLLSSLTAYDFGYISGGELIDRIANTLRTLDSMDRFRGHFYNWYDTQTLRPLEPRYISTVDSGNLAGHLITLRQGLADLPNQKILRSSVYSGISDTLRILVGVTARGANGQAGAKLIQLQEYLEAVSDSQPTSLNAAWICIDRLAASAAELILILAAGSPTPAVAGAQENQANWWARALARQCRAAADELTFLAPWVTLREPPDRFDGFAAIQEIPSLRELARLEERLLPVIERHIGNNAGRKEKNWFADLQQSLTLGGQRAAARIAALEAMEAQTVELSQLEYGFLFDKVRNLLSIGYNVGDRRADPSCYDLLASEARLSSFVAIAQGQVPQENWFALGRLLTSSNAGPILVSWSGSMFEYLMPMLVMPTYQNTLLDQTCTAAVKRQIEYGAQRGVPWGVSESAYNITDAQMNYQYRAFGVPGLGLKRGLAEDLVVSPYSTVMALMVLPEEACLNLQRLSAEGFEGRYGLYEAIDYTPARIPRGQTSALVKSFMAHHQGMSFLSLSYLLLNRPMQRRFESDPSFQATTLLLQERVLKSAVLPLHTAELSSVQQSAPELQPAVRFLTSPNTPVPEVQLLSNGRYHVMVTSGGGGYSRWRDLAVTRWREDSTRDHWGTFCYIRDMQTGEFWSTAYQPTLKRPKKYEAIFSEGRAEFRRSDFDIDTHTEIAVSPEDDIELRRISITNSSRTRRSIDITSYAEVVINPPAADASHPAFGNLFVQTEIIRHRQAILCTRRPRSASEQSPWMLHLMAVHGADEQEDASYESDRSKFIGRGNSVAEPAAMKSTIPLSDRQGSVLDPIVAIRCRITLEAGQTATVNVVSGMSETRDACLGLIEKYQDRRLADRVFDLAWTHNQVILRQINATEADAQLYGRLAGSILYANSSLRAEPSVILQNRRGQSGLWGYSISGDLPIALLQIADVENLELVRQMIQAHAYWRLKGLAVDLMIWNEDHAGYRQLLQEQILGLIAASTEPRPAGRPGEIFVRPADQISIEDRILMQTVARVIVSDSRGALADQLKGRNLAKALVPRLVPARAYRPDQVPAVKLTRPDLIFFNGFGGFTPDGREYVITTAPGHVTPAPWVNVLANPFFGTVVSESGGAYTWCENSHEYRLTPWYNDPIGDPSGEAFYIRDEETGYFWSPTPLPARGAFPYTTRHGFGYTVFEHTESEIRSEVWVYVAMDAPVKFTVVKLWNESGRPRRLSVTGYAEWVLGDLRSKTAMSITTEVDNKTAALFAQNPYGTELPGRYAFFDTDDPSRSVTGDRAEFLGRNGTLANPNSMSRSRLSGKVGAALDPCAAMQVPFLLPAGEEREIVFTLGVGRDLDDARTLVRRFRGAGAARGALEGVWQHWKHTLGAINVETPDPAVNVMMNGWLVYQVLSCRLWARTGFYQSGGAYGFRDQLQDTMALVHTRPELVRAHLLRCAGHQFPEGDVQHWWHPPLGRGVRTTCSDDFLWLALATCRYVSCTGDTGVLDELVSYIDGRPLKPEEDSYYDLPGPSHKTATLYDHCVHAVLNGLRFGEHGLPLMGSGDWNDGMNLVGERGRGESVWLGFFLYDVLMQFAELAINRGDQNFGNRCHSEAATVRSNIEANGWDGEWYRRAYFDDGSPLGSASNPECQIDSISQSWAVLSGAGDSQRSRQAMAAVDRRLVRRDHSLIQLLDPAFDHSKMNPGYIKGYVPGVRENGGQYTHAAIWTTMAFAALGDRERAWELLAMINPVNHASTAHAVATYKVEPYVVAADVYALSPHTGRGGWTWYTGSAGWMYRLILESLLGLKLEVDRLTFSPCLPAAWKELKIHYRYRETVYHIRIMQVEAGANLQNVVYLADDRQDHFVDVTVLAAPPA